MNKPKFELRQKVYVRKSITTRSRITCPLCKGKGGFIIKDTEECLTCHKCGGRGKIVRDTNISRPALFTIIGRSIEECTTSTRKIVMRCIYVLKGHSWHTEETNIYATKEEAQAAIDAAEAELEAVRKESEARCAKYEEDYYYRGFKKTNKKQRKAAKTVKE